MFNMNIIFLFTLSLAVCFCVSEQATPCHTTNLRNCAIPIGLNSRGDPIPRDSLALTISCRVWMNFWKCLDDYISTCVDDMHQMVVELILEEPRHFANEMCNPSSQMRKDFLKHSSCLADSLKFTLRTCTSNVKNVVHMVFGNSSEDGISAGCCYFERLFHCLKRNVEKNCEPNSFEVVRNYLHFFHLDILNSVCKSYDPNEDVCLNYLSKKVPAPSDRSSYVARMAAIMLKYLQ